MDITFTSLKQEHRLQRELQSEDLSLRIHRALSWLEKAELEEDDLDAQFIFWDCSDLYDLESQIQARSPEQEVLLW